MVITAVRTILWALHFIKGYICFHTIRALMGGAGGRSVVDETLEKRSLALQLTRPLWKLNPITKSSSWAANQTEPNDDDRGQDDECHKEEDF